MWKALLRLLALAYEEASAFWSMWISAGIIGVIAVWLVRFLFDLAVHSFTGDFRGIGAVTPTLLEETIILLLSAIVYLLFAIYRKLSRPKP